jgi:hypothetical protein
MPQRDDAPTRLHPAMGRGPSPSSERLDGAKAGLLVCAALAVLTASVLALGWSVFAWS